MLRTILRKVKQGLTRLSLSTIAACTFPLMNLLGLSRNLEICASTVCGTEKAIRRNWGVDPYYVLLSASGGILHFAFMCSAINDRHPEVALSGGPILLLSIGQGFIMLFMDNMYHSWLNDVTRFFLGLNQRDWFGNTVLHRRVYVQDFVEVRDLIEQNADLRIRQKPEDVNAETKTALEISEDLTKNPDPNVHARKARLTFQSLQKGAESQILNLYRHNANAFANAVYRDTQFVLLPAVGRIIYDYHLGETLENVVESFAPNHAELRDDLYRRSSTLLFSNHLTRNLGVENLRISQETMQAQSKNSQDTKLPEEESGTVVISISLPTS